MDSISDKDGNIISQTETNIRRQVISEDVSRQLLAMMENNVHGAGDYHSCTNAYVAGYRIGGKSGTAERTDRHLRGDGDYYKMMSFAAVLPIEIPRSRFSSCWMTRAGSRTMPARSWLPLSATSSARSRPIWASSRTLTTTPPAL